MKPFEETAKCLVQNKLPAAEKKRIFLQVRPSDPVCNIYRDIRTQLEIINFHLYLQVSKDLEEKVSHPLTESKQFSFNHKL